ncbi:ABC transporter permease [Clostridia bacterium]|nr:ABC transporter permease [Clostridia bacterium]
MKIKLSYSSANRAAAYPYLLYMLVFTIVPVLLVIYYSLTNDEGAFTTANFSRVFEGVYLSVMWRSVKLAAGSTLMCFLIGYPLAYVIASLDTKSKTWLNRDTILFLIIVPMWMNFLLRTYAWLTILEKNGIINSFLDMLHITKLNLLYNNGAVVLGMVYNFVPFMILPVYTVLNKMDNSLIEAAQDLGAGKLHVFFKVIFPMSIPGVISGVNMVFMPAVTTFVVSDLLGGKQFILVGNLIEQQFLTVYDWHFGSAISVILMIVILFTIGIVGAADKDSDGGQLI